MRRRAFVRRLPVVAAGLPLAARAALAGAAAATAAACSGVRYVVPRAAPGALRIDAAELGPGGDLFLQAPGMDRPVYVRREASGALVALLARCTHRGCQPDRLAGRLVCPCHGSEFSLTGEVLQGPAERPLTRYDVSEEGGEIIVRLGAGAGSSAAGRGGGR